MSRCLRPIALGLLSFACLSVGPISDAEVAGAVAGESSMPELRVGVPQTHRLGSGELLELNLDLDPGSDRDPDLGPEIEPGRTFVILVEQDGLDTVAQIEDSTGRILQRADSPLGRNGLETLVLEPSPGLPYRLTLRAASPARPAAVLTVRLERLPASSPEEKARLTATAAVAQALLAPPEREDPRAAAASSLESLQRALTIWQRLGDLTEQARAWLLIGHYSRRAVQLHESVSAFHRAAHTSRQIGDRAGQAAALAAMGPVQRQLGDSESAVDSLQQAVALREALGQMALAAEARQDLCLMQQRLGRWPAAERCYARVLATSIELGDRSLEAKVLNNLGGIAWNLGEPEPALERYREALERHRQLRDRFGEAATLNNRGALYRGLGEIERALVDYAAALDLFEQLGSSYWQARVLNNLGVTYLGLGDADRARALLLQALPLRRQVGDRRGEAVTLRGLGSAYARLGSAGRAESFYRKALELSQARRDARGIAATRRLLGQVLLEQSRPADALSQLQPALASLRQLGKKKQQAQVLELLAGALAESGELEKARQSAVESVAIARQIQDPLSIARALTRLAELHLLEGQTKPAIRHLDEALGILEHVRGGIGEPNQRGTLLASFRRAHEMQVEAWMQRHRQQPRRGFAGQALAASERARSWSLLGQSISQPIEIDTDPALRERLLSARRRVAGKTRHQLSVLAREPTAQQAQAAGRALHSALTELEAARAALRQAQETERRAHETERRLEPSAYEPLDESRIRELLDPQTVLIEFLLANPRSYLFRVDAHALRVHALPARREIEARAVELHRRLRAGPTVEARAELDAIAEMLLAPVADAPGTEPTRLAVVADGALHRLPFAALPLPGTGELVLDRFDVVSLPSASVLAVQRARRPDKALDLTDDDARVAIFADPVFQPTDPRLAPSSPAAPPAASAPAASALRGTLPTLERLPATGLEALAIAELLPADRVLLAVGSDARRSLLVDGSVGEFTTLHFATHGVLNPSIPELSGLVLSRFDSLGREIDGFLGLHDVAPLRLGAQLVVLSACETSLGRSLPGEGWIGLGRGFLYAGVPRVVSSLWPVRDRATAELMTTFYRGLVEDGLTAAEALNAAQRSLRAGRRFRHPYFWAAFTLQGDWR